MNDFRGHKYFVRNKIFAFLNKLLAAVLVAGGAGTEGWGEGRGTEGGGGVWLLPLFQADPHYLIFDKTRPLPPALPEKKTRAVKPCRCEPQCGLKN